MGEVILDTSAVLAVVFDEPGAQTVLGQRAPLICAVNYGEVVGKLTDWGADDVAIASTLRIIGYRIEPLDEYRAMIAGRLRQNTSTRTLSLGDRACLSLAIQTGLPVLTADRAWATLELGVDVRLIR